MQNLSFKNNLNCGTNFLLHIPLFQVIRETEPACNQVDYFNNILIGGDQLTVKNANGYCQTLTVERDP